MGSSARILIVDDDLTVTELVSYVLGNENYAVDAVASAEKALALIARNRYDLYILDIMLPGMDGFTLCGRLRRITSAPVLILSARDTEIDKVVGLEIGADDYLPKPFGTRELVARVRALLRRCSHSPVPSRRNKVLQAAGITIDEEAHSAMSVSGKIDLTPREYELLTYLMKNVGEVISREDLLREVWGWEHITKTRTVEMCVKRLRDKLFEAGCDPKAIEAVRGIGYRLKVPGEELDG